VKRIFSILFAVVLVLSFSLIPAAPVMATGTTTTLSIPDNVYRPAPFDVSGTTTNDGTTYTNVRFNITVSGPEAFPVGTPRADIFTITYADDPLGIQGFNETFVLVGGDFVGYWGPAGGFLLPASYSATSTFTIQMNDGGTAPEGNYEVTVELDDLNNGVLATATAGFSLSADTLYVGAGQQFTTIQAAVNAASDDDTIIVHAGTYNEQVNVNKDVTIIGVDHPIVNGSPSGFFITANGATVERFDIQVPDGVGIIVAANNVAVSRNEITGGGAGTPANREAGIYVMANLTSGPTPTPGWPNWPHFLPKWPTDQISGVVIERNTITQTTGPAIVLNRVANSSVARNWIHDISGDGIQVLSTSNRPSHNNIIERNTIDGAGFGIKVVNSRVNTVQRNDIMNSVYDGILARDFVFTGSTHHNWFERNNMTNSGGFDAHDTTTGIFTAGTANTWTRNNGTTESPVGLLD